MMDPQHLTHGLQQLADEVEPRPVDVTAVIAIAKARTKARRSTAAAGLGTVAIVGAMAAVMSTVAPSQPPPPATSSSASSTPAQPPAPGPDDRSRKLDEQFATAHLIPSQYTVEPNPQHGPVALVFSGSQGPKEKNYTAGALLKNAQGQATIQVWVLKNPPGTPLGHYHGQVFGPCQDGDKNCVRHTLPDGTVATTQVNARPPAITLSSTLTAQRPDGTYIQVITNVRDGDPPDMPVPPLTAEELIAFATAFTY
ncbi:hypothetical protein FKR81_30615 [Lentzea tibetensis]|uniref:Uncharacterized protein n=1 Tax=Lentzea tibetensis TaxID=2591470 RepID=A0A563ELP9_9PSEU|nr:hypothetical protein [Lentzea tibetensis]TWP48019.1 hypothetical protein FKR81_30615 [Lentzea tibetensis]